VREPVDAIVFGSAGAIKSTQLCREAVDLAERLDGFRVVAICDASPQANRNRRWEAAKHLGRFLSAHLTGVGETAFWVPEMASDIRAIARRGGIRYITPPERDINHPDFVRFLAQELKPGLALSLGSGQIFGADLLAVFDAAINCHYGLLPDRRGWKTTAWSLYEGSPLSGFTYHYMTTGVDEGPVLVTGEIPTARHPLKRLHYETGKLAAAALGNVVEKARRGDPGAPQMGPGVYHTQRDYERIVTIADPGALAWSEIEHRLRSFGEIRLPVGGRMCSVTRVRRTGAERIDGSQLETADGVRFAATEVHGFPIWAHRLRRALARD